MNYLEWTEAVPSSMSHEKEFYDSYKHEIKYIKSVVLSPQSGVVTIVYIWDSISKGGVHERTPGAITLTCRKENEVWKSDTNRLVLMDTKDFNSLGIGIDDLIDAFIQSSLSMIAIDKMSQTLISSKGTLKKKLFKSLNDDENLINEIL